MKRKISKAAGFTLVEIAIVLIIVGLIIGGILIGRDLIRAAELRATVAQLEQYESAVYAFRNKYNCMPGDCINARQFDFADDCAALSGHCGDGIIYGMPNWTTIASLNGFYQEAMDFWYQLSSAGLISGSYSGYDSSLATLTPGIHFPSVKMDNSVGIWVSGFFNTRSGTGTLNTTQRNGNHFWLVQRATLMNGANGNLSRGMKIIDNYLLDSKIDDGLPASGKVRLSFAMQVSGLTLFENAMLLIGLPSRPYGPAGATSNFCATMDTTPASYNLRNTTVMHQDGGFSTLCTLSIKMSF